MSTGRDIQMLLAGGGRQREPFGTVERVDIEKTFQAFEDS